MERSKDFQGFAGLEGLQVGAHRIRGERSPEIDPVDILAQMFDDVNRVRRRPVYLVVR
jgi:hypothetical protein